MLRRVLITTLISTSVFSAEVTFKFTYPKLYGKVVSDGVMSFPVLGTQKFHYETNKVDNPPINIAGTLQAETLGYYIDFATNEYAFSRRSLVVSNVSIEAKQTYNIDRLEGGLSKKFNFEDVAIRLGTGIRILQVGIINRVGGAYGFVQDDREKFQMVNLKAVIDLFKNSKFPMRFDASTGFGDKATTYSFSGQVGYRIQSGFFKGLVLGVGVIYDRVKLETQKNKADVQIVAPYLSISMPLGKV